MNYYYFSYTHQVKISVNCNNNSSVRKAIITNEKHDYKKESRWGFYVKHMRERLHIVLSYHPSDRRKYCFK